MSNKFDVIIIGSGIGGLVCACYLARTGLSVLVIEKNNEPGGYCTSFLRQGFIIDTTIHAIQNCAKGNILNRIFEEIGIVSDLTIVRPNPTDTVITSSNIIHIYNDHDQTLGQFIRAFPAEENSLVKFFNLLTTTDFIFLYKKFINETFLSVLNSFFENQELKAVWGFFLANLGSLPKDTSAVTAFALLRQFIVFGGYYPLGGMQTIPNSLVKNLTLHGGQIFLRKNVCEILLENGKVIGVLTNDGNEYFSSFVVSNCDIAYTYSTLLRNTKYLRFLERINSVEPSMSIFIVYMLLKTSYRDKLSTGPGIWYVPDDVYMNKLGVIRTAEENLVPNNGIFFSISSKLDDGLVPDGKDLVRIMVNSNYRDIKFWGKNSVVISEQLIGQAQRVFPDLRESLICAGRSTPSTMKNYTNNSSGAMCGWLNTPINIISPIIQQIPIVPGLYFAGHWVTQPYGNGGVAMAAESGRKLAANIIKKSNSISNVCS